MKIEISNVMIKFSKRIFNLLHKKCCPLRNQACIIKKIIAVNVFFFASIYLYNTILILNV